MDFESEPLWLSTNKIRLINSLRCLPDELLQHQLRYGAINSLNTLVWSLCNAKIGQYSKLTTPFIQFVELNSTVFECCRRASHQVNHGLSEVERYLLEEYHHFLVDIGNKMSSNLLKELLESRFLVWETMYKRPMEDWKAENVFWWYMTCHDTTYYNLVLTSVFFERMSLVCLTVVYVKSHRSH
jgi:hypothetical protein